MALTRRKIWLDALLEQVQAEFQNAMFVVPSFVPSELPACTLWDDTDDGQLNEYGEQANETGVSLECHEIAVTTSGDFEFQFSELQAQGQDMLGRLISASMADITLGGLCDRIVYEAGAVQYPDDGQENIAAGITLSVQWRHKLGDPYTAGA